MRGFLLCKPSNSVDRNRLTQRIRRGLELALSVVEGKRR
ncbi:hypothetical protein C3B79_3927 [Aeromonas hydrophila]|nr:hypothetical protein C3B79_3927 [Aeromonas hydrophila]